jgi:peptide/nickel transport system substrate-binding protein
MAAIIQQDLKSIGVEMKTRIIEWATFQERCRKHEFQAMTMAFGTGTDPDTQWNMWHSDQVTDGRNYVVFKNARVDELLLLGRNEFDHEKRKRYYQEIQKIVYDEQPYTFLWNSPALWGFSKRIRGVTYSPRGVWNFDPSFMAWWVTKSEQAYGTK